MDCAAAGRARASASPAARHGQRTLAFFADRVEGNLLAAHQEMQKLALLYPAGELSFEQVEAAVLNVARYDVFKLGEAVLGGQVARALRMLDGLRPRARRRCWCTGRWPRTSARCKRVKDAIAEGRPLPLALREARVWGVREKLIERVVPLLPAHTLAHWMHAASVCDGLVKGLRHPDWPAQPWDALRQLVLTMLQHLARPKAGPRLVLRAGYP